MTGYGDAKRNIFEHLVISGIIFIGALFWDHFVYLAHAIRLNLVSNPSEHPFIIGEAQIIAMVLSAVHFFRKLNEWRYYGNLIPEGLREMVKKEI